MKRVLPPKPVPKWVVLGFIPIVLALIVVLFEVISSFFQVNDQIAHLSVVSGVVKVSDGITDVTAVNGDLSVRNVRTLLKTDQGIANLTLWDGSFVIIDSGSTIEFNRQIETNVGTSFAFNLVEGKALVFNDENSQAPTHLILGGDIAVQVFRGVLGLEVKSDGDIREMVDCLAGQCLVNGVYQLNSGQNAQIGPDSTVQVAESVPYTKWNSLLNASKPNPVLLNLFASFSSTITQTISPTVLPDETTRAVSISANSALTASPSSTLTPMPTETPTSTSTITPTQSPSPSLTATFTKTAPLPTATLTFTSSPLPWYTLTPSKTPRPSSTPFPTFTNTPQPTSTRTNTNTPQPTPTSTPTITPSLTPTLQPTYTSTSTIAPSLTPTPLPTHTSTSTIAPSLTPTLLPTPNSTSTIAPSLTPTLLPTPNSTSTIAPSLIPTLLPTHTSTLIMDPSFTPTLKPTRKHSPTSTLAPSATMIFTVPSIILGQGKGGIINFS